MYSGCLWAACVDLYDTLSWALTYYKVLTNLTGASVTLVLKSPTQSYACVSLWYALLSAYTRDKLIMEQLGAHVILLMCFSLVVPPALSTFWWLRNGKTIISSVPPLPTPPVSPIPLTPPIFSVPFASISVATIAVAAAAVAISVPVAVPISVSMAIPVSVAIISAVPIAPVAVAVVTVSMAPPVLPVSVPWAVSWWGRSRRREAAELWTGLTGGHWAQGASAGEATHGHGDALGPFWTIGGLRRHRAQAASTGPAWWAVRLGGELWGAAGCSYKVAFILSLQEKETCNCLGG